MKSRQDGFLNAAALEWEGTDSVLPCRHLDFRFLASRPVRTNCCFKPPRVWQLLTAAPGNRCTPSGIRHPPALTLVNPHLASAPDSAPHSCSCLPRPPFTHSLTQSFRSGIPAAHSPHAFAPSAELFLALPRCFSIPVCHCCLRPPAAAVSACSPKPLRLGPCCSLCLELLPEDIPKDLHGLFPHRLQVFA